MNRPTPDTSTPTILRAANGDVIRADDTGLVMRLSDRVIRDIALRLPEGAGSGPLARAGTTAQGIGTDADAEVARGLPDDLDVWDLRQIGDWLWFSGDLPGRQGPRGFRRHLSGGGIVAQSRLPLMGILGLGGARAALACPRPASYPYHVLAPADHIGAVGMGGDGEAASTPFLLPLPEMTAEAMMAERLLDARREQGKSLPVFMVRVESDEAASAEGLAEGPALANLSRAAANLRAAGAALGTGARVLAVTLDFVLEDVQSSALEYRDGMLRVMAAATQVLAAEGFAAPLFLTVFETGTHSMTSGAALDGQWELSWNHAEHRLVTVAPGYMFALDDTGRLTGSGRRRRAAMHAEALELIGAGGDWHCPVLHLAERDGDAIRVTCRAAGPLTLDPRDPFGAGPAAGFALLGCDNGARVTGVTVAPDDPLAVVVQCSTRPEGAALRLAYAAGAGAGAGPFPANCGALRDDWQAPDEDGPLHRWALPALLPVRDGQP